MWQDTRFIFARTHIVCPVSSLGGKLISSSEEAPNTSARLSGNASSEGRQWGLFSPSARSRWLPEDTGNDDGDDGIDRAGRVADVEPSEEAISQTTEANERAKARSLATAKGTHR